MATEQTALDLLKRLHESLLRSPDTNDSYFCSDLWAEIQSFLDAQENPPVRGLSLTERVAIDSEIRVGSPSTSGMGC